MRCCVEARVSIIRHTRGRTYLIAFAAPERRIIDEELVYGIRV